jgi:hypothetical protein
MAVGPFRSSFRDWAAERTNFPREVAEAALAHIDGDETERAYQRGDLFDKRRRLMTAWADYCAAKAPAVASMSAHSGGSAFPSAASCKSTAVRQFARACCNNRKTPNASQPDRRILDQPPFAHHLSWCRPLKSEYRRHRMTSRCVVRSAVWV